MSNATHCSTVSCARTSHPRIRFGLRGWLDALLDLHRQRCALAKLPDHMLRDIGLSDREAQAESERAPWDVPRHWRE